MDIFIVKNKLLANEEFVVYQKIKKENNMMFIEGTICGLLLNKSSKVIPKKLLENEESNNKYIFLALKHSTFSSKKTLIPDDYKKMKRTNNKFSSEWVHKYYLQPYISPEKIIKLNEQGYELSKWIEKNKKYYLTINDIIKLEPYKKIKLLVLDRNIYDDTDVFIEAKLYKPESFFIKNSAIFWKTTDLQGKIYYKWQDEYNNKEPYDFEFEIEYKKGNWYPLKNGILPAKDEQNMFQLLGKNKHYLEFPKTTHIGFRGPMILWNKLNKLKKIYIIN
jgi:hypothetical protein